ncbi:MAG TPA: thiamine phosphate synthase [Acidimicrobiales bacterium]|nr:thiamine phosphate synthase [Acidimicrobiales bacterium]
MLGRLHYIANYQGGADLARALGLVCAALGAGVPCVQLRAKDCSDRQRLDLARRVVSLCREAGATCMIDDRADVAVVVEADGVHVGLEDIPVADARALLGPGRVLGASARTPAEARAAVAAGADYIGCGPCFLTTSKAGLPEPIGTEGLAAVVGAVSVPVIAIGGITPARVAAVLATGAHGLAVIGAIAEAADPAAAARQLMAGVAGAIGAGR